MAEKHVELAEEFGIPRWSTGYWGSRFFGITGGLLADGLAEGAATALQAQWSAPFAGADYSEVPIDAIAELAADAMLVPYEAEDPHVGTIARIRDKWNFWSGPSRDGLTIPLEAATSEDIRVKTQGDFVELPDSFDYWSRFWVLHESGHPVTGAGLPLGAFPLGATTLGPAGLTPEYAGTIRTATRRYRPAQWVPWDHWYRVGNTYYVSAARPRIENGFLSARTVTVDGILGASTLTYAWYSGDSATAASWAPEGPGPTFAQGTGSQQPSVTSGVVGFDGVDDVMVATVDATLQLQERFYWAARVRINAAGANDTLWQHVSGLIIRVDGAGTGLQVFVYADDGVANGSRTYPLPAVGSFALIEVYYDATQATEDDRLRVFVGGTEQTATASSGTLPATVFASPSANIGAFGTINEIDADFTDVIYYPSPFSNWLNMNLRSDLVTLLS